MGPRPNGRGKEARPPAPLFHSRASMGPRPNGRGKLSPSREGAPRRLRQWGRGQTAAESPCRPCRIGRTSCVNGAAAKRPRKGLGGQDAGRRRYGVNGAAAKRPRKAKGRPQRALADVRVNGAAAKRPRKADARRAAALPRPQRQWGRGQTAAERRSMERLSMRPLSVNGAAAKRPRKARGALGVVGGAVASMGPRPNGRGKSR